MLKDCKDYSGNTEKVEDLYLRKVIMILNRL